MKRGMFLLYFWITNKIYHLKKAKVYNILRKTEVLSTINTEFFKNWLFFFVLKVMYHLSDDTYEWLFNRRCLQMMIVWYMNDLLWLLDTWMISYDCVIHEWSSMIAWYLNDLLWLRDTWMIFNIVAVYSFVFDKSQPKLVDIFVMPSK